MMRQLSETKSQRGKRTLAPRTVQYVRAVLRKALGTAEKYGLVARNVATLVDPPRSEHRDNTYLDFDQTRRLMEAVEGNPLEALYAVSIYHGLRQGEALGLSWDDVDLKAGILKVRKQLQRIRGEWQRNEPKTAKSRRTIPLSSTVVDLLKDHRTGQLEARLKSGGEWGNDWDLVFTTSTGQPLDARIVIDNFKAVLNRAGLPDMRWHDMRHSCATLQLATGATPREIMETLGHSQITMTMNVYTHVVPTLQRDTADRMDALLQRSKSG